jgi:hypothetical protein
VGAGGWNAVAELLQELPRYRCPSRNPGKRLLLRGAAHEHLLTSLYCTFPCCFRRYSLERKTMGKPIASHQAIAFKLAEMATGIEASRLLTYKAAWMNVNGMRNTTWASMAKAFASDHANRCTTEAVQIFGGAGEWLLLCDTASSACRCEIDS